MTVTRSTAVNRMRQSESWKASWTMRQKTSDPSGSVMQWSNNGTLASAMCENSALHKFHKLQVIEFYMNFKYLLLISLTFWSANSLDTIWKNRVDHALLLQVHRRAVSARSDTAAYSKVYPVFRWLAILWVADRCTATVAAACPVRSWIFRRKYAKNCRWHLRISGHHRREGLRLLLCRCRRMRLRLPLQL